MAGKPLALCVKHDEPIIHRADITCPLCAAVARVTELEQQMKALTLRKAI